MQIDPLTGLPDRRELTAALREMLGGNEAPALFAVSVDGYRALVAERPAEADVAIREVVARLSRLVRADDVLAVLAPGVFALAGPGVEDGDTDVVVERIRGAFAMPVDVGGEAVSFPVTVGVAHPTDGAVATDMILAAEADLGRRLGA